MPRSSASILYCKLCGKGINIRNNDPVFKCLKCNTKPVCSQCYNTKLKVCNNCAELAIDTGKTASKNEEKSLGVSLTNTQAEKESNLDVETDKSDETFVPASLGRRFIAAFVDQSIFLIGLICLVLPGLIFYLIKDSFNDGQSPGKKLTGLRVVNFETGERCSQRESIIRNLAMFVPILNFSEYLFVLFDSDHRRIGDRWANTIVINGQGTKSVIGEDAEGKKPGIMKPIAIVILVILGLMLFGVLLSAIKNPNQGTDSATLSFNQGNSAIPTLALEPKESPSTVVQTYFEEIMKNGLFNSPDYQKMYDLISTNNRPTDYDTWQYQHENIMTAWSQELVYFSFKGVENEIISGNTAKVTFKYTMNAQGYIIPQTQTVDLLVEDGKWKLAEDYFIGSGDENKKSDTTSVTTLTTNEQTLNKQKSTTSQTSLQSNLVTSSPTTSTQTSTTTIEAPSIKTTAVLTWNGLSDDKVSPSLSGFRKDGNADGHFTLLVNAPGTITVKSILLLLVDSAGNEVGGRYWDTLPGKNWVLGVEQPAGNRLNPTDKSISKTITGNTFFELYASDAGDFTNGQSFKAIVTYTDGSTIEALTTISGVTTTTTAISTSTTLSCLNTGVGTPILSPSNPGVGDSFDIKCPATSYPDCINAHANGGANNCAWKYWSGNYAVFGCVGMPAGTYVANCLTLTNSSNHCCAATVTSLYTIASTPTTLITTTTTTSSTTSTTAPTTTIITTTTTTTLATTTTEPTTTTSSITETASTTTGS